MSLAIKVDHLSKHYQLGSGLRRHGLREVIHEGVKGLFRRGASKISETSSSTDLGNADRDLWALKDLSFEVQQGEVIGVIGRNGAGKSTLLKILSRITEPTSGRVELHGRVGSLLEVGTGFHPELTGRENIFLNGAILGMSQNEIRRKLDAIVDFSGIERFLETPVKRYSSGMYVRLAFAVAAHLQPEILIVDEVLAVGDAEFQKRCLGKMHDVAREGRTVLFVSHNLAAVQSLCQRAILLEGGQLTGDGTPDEVIHAYLQKNLNRSQIDLSQRSDRQGNGNVRVTKIQILDENGLPVQAFQTGQVGVIRMELENVLGVPVDSCGVNIGISDEYGARQCLLSNEMSERVLARIPSGRSHANFTIKPIPLLAGQYSLTVFLASQGEIIDWVIDAGLLSVVEGDYFGTGRLPPSGQGRIVIPQRFEVMNEEDQG